MKKFFFPILALLAGMTACSKDTDESEASNNEASSETTVPAYPTVSFSQIKLTESISESSEPTVTATQAYTYTDGRLTAYTFTQSYTVADETYDQTSSTTAAYDSLQAVITDDSGITSTYTLNERGYAVACVRTENGATRTYTYSYNTSNSDGKYYLENLTEYIDDIAYASIAIDYSDERALRITQKVDTYEQTYTATIPSTGATENTSDIPCLFLADLYPLTLHPAALYGKLLGEPVGYLITQITPDNNTESGETLTYTYSTNASGIVTSCQAITNSYGETYARTVRYDIE